SSIRYSCDVAVVFEKSTFLFISLVLMLFSAALHAQTAPSRLEIGGVLSAANQSDIGHYFHAGGGGRVTVNATQYLAGEVEATRQPTGLNLAPEVHTALALKGTYRAEQHSWLRFAGMNFFGVVGPAFVNRSVTVASGPCYKCGGLQRQTASMIDYGGG